jgi:competence protein ComEC
MIEELLRGRPAVFATLGLGIGIAFSSAGGDHIASDAFIVPFGIAALIAVLSIYIWRIAFFRMLLFFMAFVLLGEQLAQLDSQSYTNTSLSRIASTKPVKTILVGTIEKIDETNTQYLWIYDADSIGIVKQTLLPTHGRVLLRLAKIGHDSVPLPDEGSRLRVFSSLEPFHAPTNPHEYASDLKLQTTTSTEATGEIHSRFDYYILSKPKTNIFSQLGHSLQSAHQSLLTLLDTAIEKGNARGFVEAVVLGDRSDMDKETLNDFTTSGVAHILAVSGFNVAIVALVVAQLLRIFGIYWHRARISITMLMVLLYSAIVGFQPSVVRALLMIELYLLAKLLERKPDPLNIVMSAAAINLLLRPYDLFDVGFQLSYAGVLGMILIAPKILWLFGLRDEDGVQHMPNDRRLRHSRWVKQLGGATALSVGASMASYPVIAAHFYRISFIGLLANLPLIPLSAVITAYGFLLIPIMAVSHWAGQLYGTATAYMSDLLLFLTHLSAHVPSAAHAAASPSWIFLAMLFVSLVYCLRSKSRPQLFGRITLTLASFFALWTIGVPFSNSVLAKNEGKLQVLFFDVGQGDCILLHTPSGKTYFIDFGRVDREGNANIERTAIPFLRAEDVTEIAGGFISHMHADHYGGAPVLLKNCSVASLLTSGERVADRTARALDTVSREQHTSLRVLSRGDILHLDSDLTLYVIYPDRHVPQARLTAFGQNIHSGMLAFRIVYRNTSFLFLGDVERSEEEEILGDYGSFLQSNVVKVAHHGSFTSSSKNFVTATHPEYAVISVGEHNHFGHPAPAIVRRWMTNGAHVSQTDLDGAVLLVSDGNRVEKIDWK